jgi:YVTN family beta-propeller protein
MNASPTRRRRAASLVIFAITLALGLAWLLGSQRAVTSVSAQFPPTAYRNFEAPQVHPLAMTPDGTRLLALNTPEGRLSVFNVNGGSLALAAEIPVGLEPVSVAVRNDNEAWVVNWLSDSVSVVDLARGNVTRTFDVGDEPTDVLFTKNGAQAFVCVSGRAQVKVFDPNSPNAAPQILNIRGKQPRALARDNTGDRVFVTVFESGNQTTIVPQPQVSANGGAPPPNPSLAPGLPPAPQTGLIVKWDGAHWADERGDTRWTSVIPYTLADVDVVVIDASGATPVMSREISGVGTNIGNSVFDPTSNRLLVANQEARNQVRFEPNLRGRFVSNRLSIINLQTTAPAVTALDLNPHINFSLPAGTDAERAKSLALPADIARATDGTIYVAANGSAKVGVLSSTGAVRARIAVGQGPTGLALDEARSRLYVLDRFDNSVSVVDTRTRAEVSRVPVGFNPEPQQLRDGRHGLYDATLSAHGDVACASCHPGGHRDGVAWDLGDPRGQLQQSGGGFGAPFHPMKGPMTTQSLRGILATAGLQSTTPLHWRGDRADLSAFNPAFVSLLGGQRQLTTTEMLAFTEFVRSLTYPPNPNENLDRTVANPPTGASATRGQQLYLNTPLDGGAVTCNQCHAQPQFGVATTGLIIPAAALQETQDFKVPQLRGLYQKLGLTRAPGEQLTGYGFAHDGSFATLLDFLRSPVFTFQSDNQRRDVIEFLLALDTGTAPAVGLSVTVNADNKNAPDTLARLELLMQQCAGNACDVVARGLVNNQRRGFLFIGNRTFKSDRQSEATLTFDQLLQSAGANSELTFLGVPDGAGARFSIDRDGDSVLDGDAPAQTLSISGQIVGASGNPLPNVVVALSGTQNATAQTDAQGRYSFANLAGGGYTVVPTQNNFTFSPASQSFAGGGGALAANFVAPANVQFASASFGANEGAGTVAINVTRTGDTSGTTTVEFSTVDNPAAVPCADTTTAPGAAFARCDYATTVDALTFAPAETLKTISIPLIDDAHAEPDETVALKLGEVTGGSVAASNNTATLVIHDNDSTTGANPINATQLFVRMQYLDFLSREPEPAEPWSAVLNGCADPFNTDPSSPSARCDRTQVSSAFFRSQEFQSKGLFVFKFYKVSFGRLPLYVEIIPDMRSVTGSSGEEVAQKRDAFTAAWVERPEFVAKYPLTLGEAEFIDRLLQTEQLTLSGAVTRETLIADLRAGAKTRADVVRAVVESSAADAKEFNPAFVAMQYYGYLRRDPEPQGFADWLRTINANPSDFRSMVQGFVSSPEYRLRFGQP